MPKLTKAQEERLTLLAEECAEVIQAVMKIKRFGFESSHPDGGLTNRELLEEEIGHVEFVVDMMVLRNDLSVVSMSTSTIRKKQSCNLYLNYNTPD